MNGNEAASLPCLFAGQSLQQYIWASEAARLPSKDHFAIVAPILVEPFEHSTEDDDA